MDVTMKASLLLVLALLSACAHQKLRPIPPFDAQKVCAKADFNYLQKATDRVASQQERSQEWVAEMSRIQPLIHSCYQAHIDRSQDLQGFNVCLIADYDDNGTQKYFNFSSQEYPMSEELKKCLNALSGSIHGASIKNITFVQPIKLHVKDL